MGRARGRARVRAWAARWARYRRSSEAWLRRFLGRLPRPVQRVWRLGERTVRDSIADRVPGLAAEMALFALISLPALLLVVLGSLGFVAEALGPDGRAELDRLVFDVPRTLMAERTYDAYAGVAQNVLEQGRGDVISIGVVVSVWTGSRAVNRCLETMTIAYDVPPRPGWRRRLLSLGLTIGGLLGAAAILPALVLGPALVEWIAPDTVAGTTLGLLDLLFWPAMVVLAVLALTTLYHVGIPWRTPWRHDLPGAVLAVTGWLAAAALLRAYLAVSLRNDAVYGQLGAPVAIVLWIYVSAVAVLLGAELNAEMEKVRRSAQRDA